MKNCEVLVGVAVGVLLCCAMQNKKQGCIKRQCDEDQQKRKLICKGCYYKRYCK